MASMPTTQALFEHVRACNKQGLAQSLQDLSLSTGSTSGQVLATIHDDIGRNALQVAAYHGHIGM